MDISKTVDMKYKPIEKRRQNVCVRTSTVTIITEIFINIMHILYKYGVLSYSFVKTALNNNNYILRHLHLLICNTCTQLFGIYRYCYTC